MLAKYIIFARVKPGTSPSPEHPSLRARALEMDRSWLRGLNLAKNYIFAHTPSPGVVYSKPHIMKNCKGCEAARWVEVKSGDWLEDSKRGRGEEMGSVTSIREN